MQFQKGHPAAIQKPARLDQINLVDSMMVNPRDGVSHGIESPYLVGSEQHTEELNMVTAARLAVLRGDWPSEYFEFCGIDPEPAEFLKLAGITTKDPSSAANFVRMDSPDELFNAIIRWADLQGIPLKYEQPNCVDFLGRYVHPFNYYMQLVSERMEYCFQYKYYHLQARPEEIICHDFGHYPCPAHPEAMAGHGTFSGCAKKAFIDTHDATSEENHDVNQGTLMLAHLRDIAGMHLRQSSRNGHKLGACEIGPKTSVILPSYIKQWA